MINMHLSDLDMDTSWLIFEVLVKGKVIKGVTMMFRTKDVGILRLGLGFGLRLAIGNDVSHYLVSFLAGFSSSSGSGSGSMIACRRRGLVE
jgi:hypothetical protein